MNRFLLTWPIMLLFSCQSGNGDAVVEELNALTELINEVSSDLNELGFAIQPELIGVEVKDARNLASMFNNMSDLARPEIEDSLKNHYVRAGERLAFYDPNSQSIIFQTGALKRMPKGYLAHELTHAYQDQKWGFKNIWQKYKKNPSRELYNIINYIIEGHAELAREAYEQAQARDKKTSLKLALDLGKFVENDCVVCSPRESAANLPYSLGLRFILREYIKGGWSRAESYFTHLPNSSEQILHPDEPINTKPIQIKLPQYSDKSLPAELIHEGPMGEASLLAKLLMLALPREEAFLTSSGWNTDISQIYRTKDGQEALIWRIAFDRELDASQLESALGRLNLSHEVIRTGRVIDWIITNNQQLAQKLRSFMSRHQNILRPNSAAESSTRNLELRVKHDALGFFGPYQVTKIHVGPHH
jgi:hypothetical protein